MAHLRTPVTPLHIPKDVPAASDVIPERLPPDPFPPLEPGVAEPEPDETAPEREPVPMLPEPAPV